MITCLELHEGEDIYLRVNYLFKLQLNVTVTPYVLMKVLNILGFVHEKKKNLQTGFNLLFDIHVNSDC